MRVGRIRRMLKVSRDFCPISIICRTHCRLAPSSKCDCNRIRQL